jgi:hypothetical protein
MKMSTKVRTYMSYSPSKFSVSCPYYKAVNAGTGTFRSETEQFQIAEGNQLESVHGIKRLSIEI